MAHKQTNGNNDAFVILKNNPKLMKHKTKSQKIHYLVFPPLSLTSFSNRPGIFRIERATRP